jgi:hypothetical protein
MYIRHEQHHAGKAWPGTLVDPCLLSELSAVTGTPQAQGFPNTEIK